MTTPLEVETMGRLPSCQDTRHFRDLETGSEGDDTDPTKEPDVTNINIGLPHFFLM